MELNPLIPVGAKIKVDKQKMEKILSNRLWDDLPQIINGEVIDYKMTDGMGIGYVLLTENNQKIWVFTTELNKETKIEYKMNMTNKTKNMQANEVILGGYNVQYELNGSRNIKTIVNPFNLINWLIFTLKDII